MYTAMDVSKYIVNKCIDDGHPITNLQLQKILYFVQIDFLKSGEQAFYDDFEAWKFGPVIPEVYYRFGGYGSMPITLKCDEVSISYDDAKKIDVIVESKRVKKAWDLVEETHKPGGAWHKVFDNGNGLKHVISIDLIKDECNGTRT